MDKEQYLEDLKTGLIEQDENDAAIRKRQPY